jgi:uncharacterized membrane protein YhaH (DUF805 family)
MDNKKLIAFVRKHFWLVMIPVMIITSVLMIIRLTHPQGLASMIEKLIDFIAIVCIALAFIAALGLEGKPNNKKGD